MGVTTRSASNSPVKKRADKSESTNTTSNPIEAEPIKLLLLPQNLSSEARVLSLRHPRDSSLKQFLFCPVHGLYEFTRVANPPSEYRSLLISGASGTSDSCNPGQEADDGASIGDGYISKEASLLVATPFDLFFLLLSLLPTPMAGAAKPLFQPLDDLFETVLTEDKHLRYIVTKGRNMVEAALRKFCDTVEAGDDTMFRVNDERTIQSIHCKILRMVEKGLPPSMEERFVTRALETPMLSVKREVSSLTTTTTETETPADEDSKADGFDSQSSAASTAPSVVFSEVSATTSITTISNEVVSPTILGLQRQKVALDFITASYLPGKVAEHISKHFRGSTSPIDFAALDTHLAHLAKLKAEALASRSLGDFSRKRGLDDEEFAEERAEKKRKQEEDERKKRAGLSRGVKELAKVNVSGMKKMSAFFTKKPAPAAGKPKA